MEEFGGAFWQRKMRTLVHRIDLDGDGEVTRKDLEMWAVRYHQSGRVSEAKCAQMRELLLDKFWAVYMAEYTKAGPITADVYVGALKEHGKDLLRKLAHEFYALLFDLMDLNDDGEISLDEFTLYFAVLGLDAKMAAETFEVIDTNKDGRLSRAEFLFGGEDFFLNEKDSSYKCFWGPLI